MTNPSDAEVEARSKDAWIVLRRLEGRGALTMFEMSAKLLAEFVQAAAQKRASASRDERKSFQWISFVSQNPDPITDEEIAAITRAVMPFLLDPHSPEFDARALLITKMIARIYKEKNAASHAVPDGKCFECGHDLQLPICPKCNPELNISAAVPDEGQLPDDDVLLKLIYEHFSGTLQRALIRVVWKDSIDIDEPTYQLKRFLEAVRRVSHPAAEAPPIREHCSVCGTEIDEGNYPTREKKPRCQQCYFQSLEGGM